MKRIIIVGATGSGKTTLAQKVAQRLGITHFEIDSVYWGPSWTPIPLEDFRKHIDVATRNERWVMDGNYSKVRDLVWGRADTLVWLDYPFLLVLGRLLKRSIPRAYSRQELWNGNHETFRGLFFKRDSLFLWLLHSYPHQKKFYPKLVAEPPYSHLAFIRLRSPQKTDQWLHEIV
jgi:adenylate kinase family enzyme